MFHSVHRLTAANTVTLLFGAGHVAYSGLSELVCNEQLPSAEENSKAEPKQQRSVSYNQNNELKDAKTVH